MAELTMRRLAFSLMTYRKREAMVLVLVGLLLGASVCGLETVRRSALSAQERAVRADLAGAAYAVQASGPESRAALADVATLMRVRDVSGAVSMGAARTPAAVRVVNEPGVVFGRLVEGRAAGVGEATLSLAAAQSLSAVLGDHVHVAMDGGSTRRVDVVGITVNEVDKDDSTAVLVDVDLDAAQTDIWLSQSDPYLESSLTGLMDARAMTYRPVDSLADKARTTLPPGLASLGYAPWGMALLAGLLLVGTLVAMAPVARADVRTLVQASMPQRMGWRLAIRVITAILLVGMSAGFAVASLVLWLCRYRISGLIGHRWETIEPAWWILLGLLTATAMAGAATTAVLARTSGRPERTPRAQHAPARMWRLAGWTAACGAAFLVTLSIQKATTDSGGLAVFAPVAVVMVVAATPALVGALGGLWLPSASRLVARSLIANILVVTVFAGVVAALTAGSAGRTVHNANVAEDISRGPQPAGSFLIYDVPDRAAALIGEQFLDRGGNDLAQFQLPDEAERRLRVTSTDLVECMSEAGTLNPDTVPDRCFPQRTMAPVNIVALALDGVDLPRADPGIAGGGAVGLLEYTHPTPEAASTGRLTLRLTARSEGTCPVWWFLLTARSPAATACSRVDVGWWHCWTSSPCPGASKP